MPGNAYLFIVNLLICTNQKAFKQLIFPLAIENVKTPPPNHNPEKPCCNQLLINLFTREMIKCKICSQNRGESIYNGYTHTPKNP